MTTTENLLTVIQSDQAHYLGLLHDDFSKLITEVKKLKGGTQGSSGGQGSPAKEAENLSSKLKGLAGEAGVLVGIISAVPAALAAITYAAIPFVAALSPTSVEQFNMAMDGLKATIGEGLLPIISYATESLREWAGELLPTIRDLKPIIDRMASAASGFMAGLVRLGVAGFDALLHVLEPLINVFTQWVTQCGESLEFFAALVPIITEVIDQIGEFKDVLLGPIGKIFSLTGILDIFMSIIRTTTVNLAALAATILKAVGATETLAKFRASLEKSIASRRTPESGLSAAPKDAQISGIDAIINKMNERAFMATSGAPTSRDPSDLLEEMLKEVKAIENGQSLEDTIVKAILRTIPGGKTVAAVTNVVSTVTDTSASSRARFDEGRKAGGLVGGAAAAGAGKAVDLFDWVTGG